MRKTATIITIILLIVVGIVTARFFLGGDEDTWLCDNGQWVKHGNPKAAKPTGTCGPTDETERLPLPTNATYDEATFRLAEKAVLNSPTYQAGGRNLQFQSAEALRCPNCYEFVFTFEDQTDSHTTRVTVTDNQVTSVVSDQTFDELNQKFLK